MYYDIFLPGTWATVADPGPDAATGVHLDGPGPKRCVVYACRPLNSGLLHCLVTEGQLDALDAAGIAYLNFSTIPAGDKAVGGGPAHVFGRAVFERDGATVRMYRPGSAVPEVLE